MSKPAAEQKMIFQVIEHHAAREEYQVIFESECEAEADQRCLEIRQLGWGRPYVEAMTVDADYAIVVVSEFDARGGWQNIDRTWRFEKNDADMAAACRQEADCQRPLRRIFHCWWSEANTINHYYR